MERPRLNNTLQDDREIVHDPDWAGFGITIFTDNTMNEAKRSAIVLTPEFTYTAAQQTADFGSVQSTLTISVVQLSSVVGGGYPAILTA